jgi:quercetin dioxygenase-like cupin family protein
MAIAAVVVGAAALVAALTTAALASPPGPAGAVTASTPVRGTVSGKFNLDIPGFINFHTKGDLVVANQVFTIKPGGYVGWHSHPGPVLVIVKSGTFRSVQRDCSFEDYTAGQVYVDEGDGHVHNALNPSNSVDLELSVTYLAPVGAKLGEEADPVAC